MKLQAVKLGDLCEINLGKTPSRSNKKYWDSEKSSNNIWLSIADLLNTSDKHVFDSKEYISNAGAQLFKPVAKGTLLMSFKLTIGRLAYAGKDLFTNEAIVALPIKNPALLSKEYLYYCLQNHDWVKQTENDFKLKGRTLNKEKLKEILIPVCPFDKQVEIVKKLEVVLAEVDKAIKITEDKSNILHRFFSEYLTHCFESTKTNPEYEEVEFGSLIDLLTDYHANGSYELLKKHVELKTEKDYAYMVRSTDFENNFEKDKRYITQEAYEFMSKSKVFGGEIIMSKIGNAGKVYLMPALSYPCSLAMNLFLIRIKDSIAESQYVYYFLKSKSGERQILSRLKGMATLTITKDNVRSILIPIVDKPIQDKIINKVSSVENLVQSLDSLYKNKIGLLYELRKSILNREINSEALKI